jgi:hypothetical protein
MHVDSLHREFIPTLQAGRFMSRFLISVSIIATALFAPVIQAADEPETPVFSFSGFGTLGAVHSSEDQADFTASLSKPDGAGHTHAWSADVDSLIGAQLIVHLNPKLSTVVQVISEQDAFGSYRPHVEWANVQYQFTPDFSIRVGRTVLPAFLLTATRKVGYTFQWVRPPLEVYRILPLSSNDGADVSYRISTGGLISTFRATVGKANAKAPAGEVKARKGWGASYTAEYGSLTARATWQNAHVTIGSINPLFEAFRQFGPQGMEIADRNDVDDKHFSTVAIGVSYDPGQWFATSEWGSSHSRTALGKAKAWYVSGGYRFGEFTALRHVRREQTRQPF